ncbi:MAG TPA: hypothetical protein VLC48_01875 [Gemmatimonadota bacterium]|nr:hypothetical protein [Gemmatimonadota bacterium]
MKDATLGGYLREHERPPAFRGGDGHSYTVEILVEDLGIEAGADWRAYLFFVKWSGNEPVGHVESSYLASGLTEEAARATLEELTLHEVREVLDGLVSG